MNANLPSLAEKWIRNSAHKPFCNLSPGNIYVDGEFCDCGLEEALKSLSSPAVSKEKTLDQLINQAAYELPHNWEITIEIQQGYAEVIVTNPEGTPTTFFEDDTNINQQLQNALTYIRQQMAQST